MQPKRTLLKVRDVAAGERDADLVGLGGRDLRACRVVVFFALSDVTHFVLTWKIKWDSGDYMIRPG